MNTDRPLALYRRYFWENKNISWIYTGDVDKLFASREHYYKSIGEALPVLEGGCRREVDDLIIGASLACEAQTDRDSWGWTIRIPMKPWGIFCGVEPEGAVCARFTQLEVEAGKDPVGGFAVQRVSEDKPIRQSSLIPRDVNTKYLVEQYFDESEQVPARIAIVNNEALLAMSSPDAEWGLVENLKEHELIDLFHSLLTESVPRDEVLENESGLSEAALRIKRQFADVRGIKVGEMIGDLKLMHEAVFYYGCRCSEEQIRRMIDNLPEAHQKELWLDSDRLEVQCPRCGRNYVMKKGR